MKTGLLRSCCRIAAGVALFAAAGTASAAWPDKVIRIVVPFAAGGSTDLVARKIAEGLSQRLGANVIVENRPGAGGTVGTEYVARQPADGYTILMGSVSTHGSAPCVYSKLPYDAVKDFTPLTVVATIPNVMSVNQSVPANNLQEFVALLKKEPEKYSFASNGQGTSNHLAAELFKSTAGVSMVHVPYRGSGPALIDLVGGQINMMMDVVMTSYPYIKDGKIKALAVTSPQRSAMLPDVPTVAESGYPGYEAMVWFGMLAPANMPEPLRTKLTDGLVQTLHAPAMKTYLEQQGAQVSDVAGPAFGSMIKDEISKWCQVVKKAGIRLD
ncbi:tripartite tricarboxylate transporter substrate binding protein [Achromobacter mucicolens]|jgi:tripartite-type tricarboxylate transporter receptor subunit TctC|uniref:Tripartite tricarboxylate transporter substrate binding protein n=1 Tax=Achromobacter mucicolens TaxID=1389922 RepID=A0ABD4YX89_9BURK|nr:MULTISPECIES: tripartite tricarboxylate transporter substrate binding protein [Achromobacter]KXJ66473.1 ABC transporter substrate-binding protein [Achromobacter xylosoxidans]MCP2514383.1 tripartite tricarboxylate transporter substrate binding protein [Achromobacter mucicolens]MCU6617487.1 tripartite tricarboxylate transporter substrate binding protein [Achromobacter mucicolens]MDG9971703.1 tripartite tricarboxylate transporter substrate binding protein [Achromobacter mucicolens]MDH1179499.1